MPVLAWRNDTDGFAFANRWSLTREDQATMTALLTPLLPGAVATVAALAPPEPAVMESLVNAASASAAFPTLPRSYGMCGGMAYLSLDYWIAQAQLPRGAHRDDQPERTSTATAAIRDLLWSRLVDSLTTGGVLLRTLEWSLLVDHVPARLGGGTSALLERTRRELTLVRESIDYGFPCPIGLVYRGTGLWDQHQVIAYGYEVTGTDAVTLFISDSNAPQQYGNAVHRAWTLDFTGPSLVVGAPAGDPANRLAGFFCSNYTPVVPPQHLATGFGRFLAWPDDDRIWLMAGGARMPLADTRELASLGGSPPDVRTSSNRFSAAQQVRPRDGTLLRELSDGSVFLFQGGAPFRIPHSDWLERFGGAEATRTVPDHTLAAFDGPPDDGTLLREFSGEKIFRIEGGARRWVTTPAELRLWGDTPSVRVVPDGALAALPEGPVLPAPNPGECVALRARVAQLNARIEELRSQLVNAVGRRENALAGQLRSAERERMTARSRVTALRCP